MSRQRFCTTKRLASLDSTWKLTRLRLPLAIEVAADAGEAARQLEPVARLVERIAQALGVAKRKEGPAPLIPVPPRRIEAPKKQKNGFERPLDDEIPF